MVLRKGFALLEVMLALGIGSIVMVLLLQSTNQMSAIYAKVTTISGIDREVTLIQQQFERDFSGIFLPEITLETEQHSEGPEDQKDKDKKEEKKPENKLDSKAEEEKPTLLPHAFFSQNDDKENCILFTCLTTNPVTVYGQTTPRLVRVVYRLSPDPEHTGTFALSRQQSDTLDFEKFKKDAFPAIRSYVIAGNIARMKVEFLIPKPSEEEKEKDTAAMSEEDKQKKKKEEEAKPKREFVTLQDWPELKDKERKEKKRPLTPSFIHVTLTLVDENDRPSTFEFWYAPLYDTQSHFIDKMMTLPSVQEMYHRRFADHKAQQQMEAQEAMKNVMRTNQ